MPDEDRRVRILARALHRAAGDHERDWDGWLERAADLLDRLEGEREPVDKIIRLAYEAQKADGEVRSGDCGAALEELARIFRENPGLRKDQGEGG